MKSFIFLFCLILNLTLIPVSHAATVTASLTEAETGTPAVQTTRTDRRYTDLGTLSFSITGTFVASIQLQRKFVWEAANTWGKHVIATYTAPKEDVIVDPTPGVQYRLFIPAAGHTSGTAVCQFDY